jgi:diadenylate cyclase
MNKSFLTDYYHRISEYGWPSVITELAIIALVLYAVSWFLQGTRGLRLMRGLILTLISAFLILDVMAERLQLERIEVLFKPLVTLILFASIVVFQPELRRALMRIGEALWLRRSMKVGAATILPILQAVGFLANRKIGALIAIQRQMSLSSIAETGVLINADLSSELLKTIFFPGTALHDLGVIVQDGRLTAAGCQFPLTDSDELDPTLGSRHRSAVGLAEDSDALIVIVSEETGAISLAANGKLYRNLSLDELEKELRTRLNPEKWRPGRAGNK